MLLNSCLLCSFYTKYPRTVIVFQISLVESCYKAFSLVGILHFSGVAIDIAEVVSGIRRPHCFIVATGCIREQLQFVSWRVEVQF